MKKIVVICDRCGREVFYEDGTSENIARYWHDKEASDHFVDRNIDLCEKCYKSLTKKLHRVNHHEKRMISKREKATQKWYKKITKKTLRGKQ